MRALLFVSVLAAVSLGASAGAASAATLWANTAHTARVTVGATADLTAPAPGVAFTTQGAVFNLCTHGNMHAVVSENSDARVTLTVVGSTLSHCTPSFYGGTHTPPWRINVTGAGTTLGANTRYAATVDRVVLEVAGVGLFTGNLENGVTAVQPTAATSPICLELANATGMTDAVFTFNIDARYCLANSAAAWSLTS